MEGRSTVFEDLESAETLVGIADDLEEFEHGPDLDRDGAHALRKLIIYLRRDDLGSARALIDQEWFHFRESLEIAGKIFELDRPMVARGFAPLEGARNLTLPDRLSDEAD